MNSSIQEKLKKINSSLSIYDSLSIVLTSLIIITLFAFLYIKKQNSYIPIEYIKHDTVEEKTIDDRPFASKNGKTYTFYWCSSSGVISEKNKIYFESEEIAISSGMVLSKMCQK